MQNISIVHFADSHGSCIEGVLAELLGVVCGVAAIYDILNWPAIHMIKHGVNLVIPNEYLFTSEDALIFEGCK